MPLPRPSLSLAQCTDHVVETVFGGALGDSDVARHQVGIELEWLTATDQRGRLAPEQFDEAVRALSPYPSGSRLTIEPGGQVELSSAPAADLDEVCRTTADELYHLDRWCAGRDIELVALGSDPERRPARVLRQPRYAAMERYFDSMGPAGRTMMCNTASIQLNIGLGAPDETAARWRTLNRLGPVLIAAFANSPLSKGGPSGWASTRLRTWWTLDPTRSAPIDGDALRVRSPSEAWLAYALSARVMLIRRGSDHYQPITTPMTFQQWLDGGHELGWPTIDDFAYHLTTLFPPVRPRGWFELRSIDALPTPFWVVAAAVAYALTVDGDARARAARVLDRTGADRLWVDAAQLGLGHPALETAAAECFDAARQALPGLGVSDGIGEVVDTYIDRWVARGRTPADDRLDAWRRRGELVPPRESPVPYGIDIRADR